MRPGLHILNYHNISWENSLLTQGLLGNHRPDIFREQLGFYSRHGDLISTDEALSRLRNGTAFKKPTFCLWFDDGFAGVRTHAFPACKELGITAAIAVNSRFVLRQEMFYVAKLSFLAAIDGLRLVRDQIGRDCPEIPLKMRSWIKRNFRSDFVPLIDDVYNQCTTAQFRADAFRIYDTAEGIRSLSNAGWLISNHTAAHYPLSERRSWTEIKAHYDECAPLVAQLKGNSRLLVTPFSFLPDVFAEHLKRHGLVVQVENRINTPETFQSGVIYRHDPGYRRVPAID